MMDGNGFWNNSENGETVVLEYSTDNGLQWALMQSLNTVYPALSNWTSFSMAIPSAASGPHTQFRWRQQANSGLGFDTWALDDLRVQAPAPVPPSTPPFIISSPSSATSIAVFWVAAERVSYYIIERRQGTNAWVLLRTLPAASNYYTDDAVFPGTGYSYRVQSVNASGASSYSPITKSVTWGLMEEWLMNNYGCNDGLTNGLFAAASDGTLQPLIRYAFNLAADEPAKKHCPGISTNGLPAIWLDTTRNRLTVEFVRRKASLNPGVNYQVQFSANLFDWNAAGSVVFTNALDLVWERVRFEDQLDSSTNQTRFGRVVVGRP
jgi:hypothetical protein